MKILVTGGAGFIGSHVVDLLVGRGHSVIVIDDLSSGKREQVNPQATFYEMDIRDPSLPDLCEREAPEVIIHFAAQIEVRRSVEEPELDAEVNILGGLHVAKSFLSSPARRRIIFASTGGAMYGDVDILPTPESLTPVPGTPYGIAKLASELYLRFYSELGGFSSISLRLGNVYGPRQNPHGEAGVVAIFSERMLRGDEVCIYGDGEQTRDFIFVSDVAEAVYQSMMADEGVSGSYNIATGREVSVNEIVKLLSQRVQDPRVTHGPQKQSEQRRSCLDISKAKKELGFQPSHTLEEGIRETFAWFKKHNKDNQ